MGLLSFATGAFMMMKNPEKLIRLNLEKELRPIVSLSPQLTDELTEYVFTLQLGASIHGAGERAKAIDMGIEICKWVANNYLASEPDENYAREKKFGGEPAYENVYQIYFNNGVVSPWYNKSA